MSDGADGADPRDAGYRRLLAAILARAMKDARQGDYGALTWLDCPWAVQSADLLDLAAPDDLRRRVAAALASPARWPHYRGN